MAEKLNTHLTKKTVPENDEHTSSDLDDDHSRFVLQAFPRNCITQEPLVCPPSRTIFAMPKYLRQFLAYPPSFASQDKLKARRQTRPWVCLPVCEALALPKR